MGKDLIDDRYGRFYELPEQLAARHHQVSGHCLTYHSRKPGSLDHIETPNGVEWLSRDLPPLYFDGAWGFHFDIQKTIKTFRPEVIIGCSDAFQVIYSYWLGNKYRIPVMIDLYDQFEAYGANRIPGLTAAYRHALKNASGVTCVSPPLCRWVATVRGSNDNIFNIGNAIDTEIFKRLDKNICRKSLGLPENAKLIGTAGALTKSRGIETLYKAHAKLIKQHPDIHLVLAGPRDLPLPIHSSVHDLGQLDHLQIPLLLNALDVGIICNQNSLFAQFCHPQKLLEMQACNLSTVASRVGIFALEGGNLHSETYTPEDPDDLCKKIFEALSGSRKSTSIKVPTWTSNAQLLEGFLQKII